MNCRLHSHRPPLFDPSPDIFAFLLPCVLLDRHRDENPFTASPLDSALTNGDARNLFRIRSYKKCRVSPAISCSSFLRPSLLCSHKPFAIPFFLTSYELQIVQVLCFDIHTNCPGGVSPSLRSPEFRILFQVPYTLSPLFATLTKTAGVVVLLTKNPRRKTLPTSHSGPRSSPVFHPSPEVPFWA